MWCFIFFSFYLCFLDIFFFNDTATTEIYTLSLHDALPISDGTSLRQPLNMVNHSSKRCRSEASFQACCGARSVGTVTSTFAITFTYPRGPDLETKLTVLENACTAARLSTASRRPSVTAPAKSVP